MYVQYVQYVLYSMYNITFTACALRTLCKYVRLHFVPSTWYLVPSTKYIQNEVKHVWLLMQNCFLYNEKKMSLFKNQTEDNNVFGSERLSEVK